MKTIKEITAIDTFPVRHPVLRPGKPTESCRFEGDGAETTKHFGIFVNDELAGIASLFENPNDLFNGEKQFQMRGMAVLKHFRMKGLGGDLVEHAESYVKSKHGNLIWFNARVAAVPFYEKLGYKITSDIFEIANGGPHYVMYKLL